MNFKIIERRTSATYLEDIYPNFKSDYLNPKTTVSQIKEKYSLSHSDYKYLRKKLKEETGIEIKPNPFRKCGYYDAPNKYIYSQSGGYIIRKNGVYYCRCKTINEAQKIRDELIKNNWEKKL